MGNHINKVQKCCPGCDGPVKVRELYCEKCGLTLRGNFPPDTFSGLSGDEQEFVCAFVLNDGSIKDMARYLGKSYPTVRHMLDGIIHRLRDTRK